MISDNFAFKCLSLFLFILFSTYRSSDSKLEYSESDYVYDDSIDEYLTAKTPNNFGKGYKYGAYQAILLGHTWDVRLRDEDYIGDYDDEEFETDDEDEPDPDYPDFDEDY